MVRKLTLSCIVLLVFSATCLGQYNRYGLSISVGTVFSSYLGNGEGDNHFKISQPGIQFEMAMNGKNGFEWVFYGISYFRSYNYVGANKVLVEFFIPYYTEFIFYQKKKKNPIFGLFGYDLVRMKFPNMEKPDSHHNITFGGGWNLKLSNRIFMQFKVKPYFVISNSIGQWFGVNASLNFHIGFSE